MVTLCVGFTPNLLPVCGMKMVTSCRQSWNKPLHGIYPNILNPKTPQRVFFNLLGHLDHIYSSAHPQPPLQHAAFFSIWACRPQNPLSSTKKVAHTFEGTFSFMLQHFLFFPRWSLLQQQFWLNIRVETWRNELRKTLSCNSIGINSVFLNSRTKVGCGYLNNSKCCVANVKTNSKNVLTFEDV